MFEAEFDKIVRKTYATCEGKSECVVDFDMAFDFDWDTMYVFGEGVENAGLDEVLDFKYEKNKGINRLILFVKNKKIVYEQSDNFSFSDESGSPVVRFHKENQVGIARGSSKYKIRKSKGNYYILTKLG